MMRSVLINAALVIMFALTPESALSQTTEGSTDVSPPATQPPSSRSQETTVTQENSEPPWYYYWPQENLNPFEMSTLGENSGMMGSETRSTLGTSGRRPTNLEVNPPRQTMESNDFMQSDEEPLIAPPDVDSPDEDIDNQFTGQIDSNLSPSESSGEIYKWVDENGVVNVTNELNAIPIEYRDEARLRHGEMQAE